MTTAQKARIEGFNASLQTRGVTLTTDDGEPVLALVEFREDATDDFEQGPEQRCSTRVFILRETAEPLNLAVNDTLTTDDGRIARILIKHDHPANIALILECELV